MMTSLSLVFASVFFGIVAMFLLAALCHSPSVVLMRRLARLEYRDERGFAGEEAKRLLRQQLPDHEAALLRLSAFRGVQRLVIHSGIKGTAFRLIVLNVMSTAFCFVLLEVLFSQLLVSVLVAAAVALAPWACLFHLRNKRQQKFEEQLPDTLMMVARSLRAGHSFTAALELVSSEQPEPTSSLFRTAYEQQQLGIRTVDALVAILDEIDSTDMHFFVTIIRINSETGGNLSEVLEKLADTIRARIQIRRQVRTYTAEGRISSYVLLGLPVVVFLFFTARNPKYMEPFFTERICQWSLVAAAVAQVVGFLIIRTIIRIRI
jgi:tight adherence protein B